MKRVSWLNLKAFALNVRNYFPSANGSDQSGEIESECYRRCIGTTQTSFDLGKFPPIRKTAASSPNPSRKRYTHQRRLTPQRKRTLLII